VLQDLKKLSSVCETSVKIVYLELYKEAWWLRPIILVTQKVEDQGSKPAQEEKKSV
jgi:hypothetical protein